jgi:uncharacterized protein YecE (DUF72 family)
MERSRCFTGTAGWGIPTRYSQEFPQSGTHLERYVTRLAVAEINSSFYKPHRRETYERWARSVPEHFRFAVKMPKAITHEQRLVGSEALADVFLRQVEGLGEKLSVLLVQLPPSLEFAAGTAGEFFDMLSQRTEARIVCEPRHPSWFEAPADTFLRQRRVARVAADPAKVPAASLPAGWAGLAYFRWHGTPRVYYSEYGPEALALVGRQMKAAAATGAEVWCIFDNTAASHALGNALAVDAAMQESAPA